MTFLDWDKEKKKLNMTTIMAELYLLLKVKKAPSEDLFQILELVKSYAQKEWGEETSVFFKEETIEVQNPHRPQRAKFRLNKDGVISTFE